MNILKQSLRQFPKLSQGFQRHYAKESFSIEWVRPEEISCIKPEKSGDLGLDYKIDPNKSCVLYENISELEKSDDIVKKLLSLKYNSYKEKTKMMKERATALVKRHKHDKGSHEYRIAVMTADIHRLQEYMEANPRNKICKVSLKELIDKRRRFLRLLREWDYRRFEWILEKLNLVFKPDPEYYENVSRKGSIRKLCDMHCQSIRQEKLNAYKNSLKAQQKDFFKEKAEKLAFIREEEIACGLEPTITLEEIDNAKKIAAEFSVNPK